MYERGTEDSLTLNSNKKQMIMSKTTFKNEWAMPIYDKPLSTLFLVKTIDELVEGDASRRLPYVPAGEAEPPVMTFIVMGEKADMKDWAAEKEEDSGFDPVQHPVLIDVCERSEEALQALQEKARRLKVTVWIPVFEAMPIPAGSFAGNEVPPNTRVLYSSIISLTARSVPHRLRDNGATLTGIIEFCLNATIGVGRRIVAPPAAAE